MAGSLSFRIEVLQSNTQVLPEMQKRCSDISALLNQIIDGWAELNKQKFLMASGQSAGGAQVDPTVRWQALTPGYFKEKSKHFPDQIMVRTGSLRDALTSPTGFFRMVNPQQAVFGSPNSAEDAMKMNYNWKKRQVVFLGDPDKNMIRRLTQAYFKAPPMQSAKQAAAQMDADFTSTIGPASA